MNEKFRNELDRQLESIAWRPEDTAAVMKRVKAEKRRSVRAAAVLAAALAVMLALGCAAYAEYSSGLLTALFGGRAVRPEAEELLVFEPVSMTRDGITMTITEYLYDGQEIHMAGEMRNDTGEALLCGMWAPMGGTGSGVFNFNGGDLVLIRPGETAAGRFETDMNLLAEIYYRREVSVQAVALKPNAESEEYKNNTGYYDRDKYYGTDLAETVFDETVSFPMIRNQARRPSATRPGVKEVRMEEYGYTIVMHRANFAAASSRIEFEVIPDDPNDIQAYGDEGSDGHERLYRWYEILDANGGRLFDGLTGGANFGWSKGQSRLRYTFEFQPLESVPGSIVLVPLDEDGNCIMDEAVTIPVI